MTLSIYSDIIQSRVATRSHQPFSHTRHSMRIVFLRHSKTLSADDDSSRVLSPEGIELARSKRTAHGNPEFDVILHSRKMRTRETALIYAGKEDEPNVQTHEIPQLWTLDYYESTRVIDAAYNRFGNTAVRHYFDECPEAMYEFANGATDALIPRFIHFARGGMKHMLVVGHAILTQAICVNLLGGEPLPQNLLNDVLEECEGYECDFEPEGWKFQVVRLLK